MQHIAHGYRGISLLLNLNWDRLLYLSALTVALMLGGFIASL